MIRMRAISRRSSRGSSRSWKDRSKRRRGFNSCSNRKWGRMHTERTKGVLGKKSRGPELN